MEFFEEIQALSDQAKKQLGNISTEQATINALVMPFINALGYDVFNPTDFHSAERIRRMIRSILEKFGYSEDAIKIVLESPERDAETGKIADASSEEIIRLNESNYIEGKPRQPIALIFDGERIPINTWAGLLQMSVEKIIDKCPEKKDIVFTIRGKTRSYFSRKADDLREPKRIGKSNIYIETNFNARNTMGLLQKILKEFELPGDLIKVVLEVV